MRNNKTYFGGKIYKGKAIGKELGGLLPNLVKGVGSGI